MKIIPQLDPDSLLRGRISVCCFLCLFCVIRVISGGLSARAAQKPEHVGTKLEGYATIVTPDSISVFDKKNQLIEIHTDKDYSSLVGIAAPVTVWYTTEGGVNHLEDIIYPTKAATFVPSDLIREHIKRITILPRPEGVDDYEGLVSAISKYLVDNTGWYVAPPELAMEIASRSKSPGSSLDAIDPNTGEVDMQRYLAPQGALMTSIAKTTRTDAVLEIQIIKVKANVKSGVATWDDRTESVASRKARSLTPWEGLGKGWVYATTVDMELWGKGGKLLWKKRRGFAVMALQSGFGAKYRERPLSEVYGDSEAMQRWLIDTFRQLAPPVRGTGEESPQLSPELQKQLEKARKAGQEQQ